MTAPDDSRAVLRILAGSAGSGKTTRLYEELIASSQSCPDSRHILLCPDQFTMQTQQQLTAAHPRRGLLNIEVMSFTRLALRVFDSLGMKPFALLDDVGKGILLRRAAGERKKDLTVFARNLSRAGFISRMKSMIGELAEYGLDADRLHSLAEETAGNTLLSKKLEDLSVICSRFFERLAGDAILAESILPRLAELLPSSEYLQNSFLYLDDFSGFTAIQYRILEQALARCAQMTVTVTLPADERNRPFHEHELFALSKKTISRLQQMAWDSHERTEVIWLPSASGPEKAASEVPPKFAGHPELAALERNFWRYGKTEKYENKPQDIRLAVRRDPEDEAAFAAGWLKEQVRQGLRWRECAVVAGDLERYRAAVEEAFAREGIPCFIDRKKGLSEDPCLELVRSSLQAARTFRYEDVFRWLRCGLSPLSREETDVLDLYVRAAGIRGRKAWAVPWQVKGDEEKEVLLNDLRVRVEGPLSALKECLQGTAAQTVDGLRQLMQTLRTEEQMMAWADEAEERGDMLRAQEYRAVSEGVEELLSQTERILGSEKIPQKEFCEILDAGIGELRLGTVPPAYDQVFVGDRTRSRLSGIRGLIFVGMNEDIVPSRFRSGVILTEEEREALEDRGVELAPTQKENSWQEKFDLYRILTAPSERLTLTWSRFRQDGTALRPSPVISRIKKIFPALSADSADDREKTGTEEASGPVSALQLAASGLYRCRGQALPPALRSLAAWLRQAPETEKKFLRILDGLYPRTGKRSLSRDSVKTLFGEVLTGSVSKFESYAKCPYAYYLTYGLHLQERAEFAIDPLDRGLYFHSAMEEFFSRLMREDGTTEVEEERRRKLAKESAVRALLANDSWRLLATEKNRYQLGRWERIFDRTTGYILEEMHRSGFTPRLFEYDFHGRDDSRLRFPLAHGRMTLTGTIDRMDFRLSEGRALYRVVDYKTGSAGLDLAEVDAGVSLQLPVYLLAAEGIVRREFPGLEPVRTGAYYYLVQEPVLTEVSATLPEEEETREKIAAKLELRGIHDRQADAGPDPEKPVRSTKNRREVDTARMTCMLDRTERVIRRIGDDILGGRIDIEPYRRGPESACDFCRYASVCGFDPELSGFSVRRAAPVPEEELFARWEAEKEAGR